jgi:hypothetical protein
MMSMSSSMTKRVLWGLDEVGGVQVAKYGCCEEDRVRWCYRNVRRFVQIRGISVRVCWPPAINFVAEQSG